MAQLWKLRDENLIHIRSLKALGVTVKQCEGFLTPIILSRLPSELRLKWAMDGDEHKIDLDWFLTFSDKEISRIERSEAFKGKISSCEEKKLKLRAIQQGCTRPLPSMLHPSEQALCTHFVARNINQNIFILY